MSQVNEPIVESDAIEKLVRYRDRCKSEVSLLWKITALAVLAVVLCQWSQSQAFAKGLQYAIYFAGFFLAYTVAELSFSMRRLNKYKRLVDIAKNSERRAMTIISCLKHGWIDVAMAGAKRVTRLRLDPKIENATQEELAVQCRDDGGSFPLNCLALIDKTTNQTALIYVKNVLLGVRELPPDGNISLALRRGQAVFKAESIIRTSSAEARSKINDRTSEDRRDHLEQMVRDLLSLQRQMVRMVTLGFACLLLSAIGVCALCFFLFGDLLQGFVWLILIPPGLLIMLSFMVPLFCRWTVKQVEDSVAIVRTAVPVDIQITKIEDTASPSNKYGDGYWIEFQQSKLTDPPRKRVKIGSFAIALGAFWNSLYRGFKEHGSEPDGPFPLPAIMFMDPSTHDPVAVAVDDVLTCVDQTTYAAATGGDNDRSLTEESS